MARNQAMIDRVRHRRTAAMSLGGGYSGAGGTDGWHRSWNPGVRDAAGDVLPGLRELRARARDLSRNHPIAASAIGTKVQRAIGTGLALSAQPHRATLRWSETQAEDWRLATQAEFRLFADSTECDIRRTLCFDELCALALRTVLDSGDCLTVLPDGEATPTMPYKLRIQLLEADRVGNPDNAADTATMAGGIEFGPGGAPLRAHVYDQHPGTTRLGAGNLFKGTWVDFVGASGRRKLLHHMRMLRPEQPRGVPDLAPVMSLFKLLGTYTDAEVKAAVVSAYLTAFIETPAGAGVAPVFGLGDPANGGGQGAGPRADEIELGPASIIGLAPGEKATVADPGRPNPQFGSFVQSVLDQLGAGLFIGPEMLMKKYSTSYVAARAAFLDAWKHLLDLRTLMARSFCQPIYETWMAEAVILGRVPAPGFFANPLLRWAYTRAIWTGDSQGSINPKDEVAAFAAAVDARLCSRERAEWELFGTDFGETYDTKKAEQDRLRKDGMLPEPKAGAAAPATAAETPQENA